MAKQPEKKPDEQQLIEPPADEPVTLTKAELQKLIDENRAEVERTSKERIDGERQKEKEQREREEQEAQGKFKELADKAEEKREAAERDRDAAKLDTRRLTVKDQLRDYLAEKHPAHAAAAKWIMPAIDFDLKTEDGEIVKRIAKAADEYVKDNPRQTGGGGAPGTIGRGQRASEGEKPKKDEAANGAERGLSRTARMAF